MNDTKKEERRRKNIVVIGAGGFIGYHLVTKLKSLGHWVRGVDLKQNEYHQTDRNQFIIGDASRIENISTMLCPTPEKEPIDELYQLIGGKDGKGCNIGHIAVNTNILSGCVKYGIGYVFYASDISLYKERYKSSAFAIESIYKKFANDNRRIKVAVGRLSTIFGPLDPSFDDSSVIDICKQVSNMRDGGMLTIKGDGLKSYLFIQDCVNRIIKCVEGVEGRKENLIFIGSTEMYTLGDIATMIIGISGKDTNLSCVHPSTIQKDSIPYTLKEKGTEGQLGKIEEGLGITFEWVDGLINKKNYLQRRAYRKKVKEALHSKP